MYGNNNNNNDDLRNKINYLYRKVVKYSAMTVLFLKNVNEYNILYIDTLKAELHTGII